MSYDILRQSPGAVELFLNRAKFDEDKTKGLFFYDL